MTTNECKNAACEVRERLMMADILESALLMGGCIMIYGGESGDAEEAVESICNAYGAKSTEVWAITNLITATVVMPGGYRFSLSKRLGAIDTNLAKLDRTRKAIALIVKEKPDAKQRDALYAAIKKTKPFSNTAFLCGTAICTFGWCLFFGGRPVDALFAGLIGFIMMFCKNRISGYFRTMASTILTAALTGTLAVLLLKIGAPISYSLIAISVIMLQIPTLLLVNGIRELFGENIVCGTLKTLQATLITISIALGYAIVLFLFRYAPAEVSADPPAAQFLFGGTVAVIGSAFVFKTPLPCLLPVALGAFGTAVLWLALQSAGIDVFANSYVCAALLCAYSVSVPRFSKKYSTNSLLMPAVTILLPGKYFFYTMNYLVNYNESKFWHNFIYMTEAVVGIVFGIVTITLVITFVKKFIKRHTPAV